MFIENDDSDRVIAPEGTATDRGDRVGGDEAGEAAPTQDDLRAQMIAAAKAAAAGEAAAVDPAPKKKPAKAAPVLEGEADDAEALAPKRAAKAPGKVAPAALDAVPPEVAADADELSVLETRMRIREREQRARVESDRALSEARAEAQRIRDEAKAEVARVRAEARAELVSRLRQSPAEAIRELGVPHKELLDGIVQAGTPEGEIARQLRELTARIDRDAQAAEERRKADDAARAEQETRARAHQRAEAERQFLSLSTEEKHPSLRALYDEPEIIQRAYTIAENYRKRTGEACTDADLLDYMEALAAKRLAALTQKLGSVRAVGAQAGKTTHGPRTLSARAASERRSVPKPISEMTPEEEREALLDAARSAAKAAPQRV